MKTFQILLFPRGIVSLSGSLAFIGGGAGNILYSAGLAILVTDIVRILLWTDRAGLATEPLCSPTARANRFKPDLEREGRLVLRLDLADTWLTLSLWSIIAIINGS